MTINPYEVLGVHRKSSDTEIRQAYIALAQKYHPDVVSKRHKIHATKFYDVNAAYQLIKTKEARHNFSEKHTYNKPTCLKCAGKGATSKSKGLTAKEYAACTTCGGAGVILNKKEETKDVIELRGTAGTIRKGRNNKR